MDVVKFLNFCVAKLVDQPELVTVQKMNVPDKEVYEVRVASQDLAKVIGREGRTFKALRALICIANPDKPHDLKVDAIV